MSQGIPLRFAGPNISGQTNFFAGALGAGGYGSSLIMASDGSAMTLRNDTGCSWLWSRSTNKWKNATTTPGMNTINATTPLEAVFAPSNPNIMYLVYAAPTPVQGPGGGASIVRNYLWKSTDKGVTWTRTNTTIAISGDNSGAGNLTPKFNGPRMAVDPNNADVVYIASTSGAIYVTYDGGTTISVVSGLLSALPSAVVNGSAPSSGGGSFTVVSNPLSSITGPPGVLGYFGFDPTWPLALGTNGQTDAVTSSSGNTIGIQTLQARDGGSGTTSIGVGDTVYFGSYGSICVDSSAGTIANPGGSGVISKTVYVSWMSGVSNIWRTMNGGVSWSAMSGGPAGVLCKMKMSNDGALAGGGVNTNILYVCDQFGTNVWRYVENPPTGSNLSATTWTNASSGLTSSVVSVAIHPTVAGKLCALNNGGGQFISTDFGTTYGQANASTPAFTIVSGAPGIPPNGTDTPWLTAVTDVSVADIEYDKGSGSDPTRTWIADGIGVLYTWPTLFISGVAVTAITKDATGAVVTLGSNDWPIGQCFIPSGISGMTQANNTRFYIQSLLGGGQVKTNVDSSAFSTFTGAGVAQIGNILVCQSEVMDSLTMQKIVKAPAPNGRILMACQDRQLMTAPNVTTYPTTYYPLGVSNPTDIVYSNADPTVVWAATNSTVVRSTDSGVTFNPTTLVQGWCMLASISALNCVAVTHTGAGANIQHTTDGGTTWNDCLFAGSALNGSAPGPFQGGCSYWIVNDDFGNYYYWNEGGFVNGITGITNDATGATFTLPGKWAIGQSFVPGGISGETLSVSGITLDVTGAVITLSSTTNLTVGMTFVVNGVSTTTQANGVTFTIAAITPTGGLTAGQVKTNINSAAWTAYGSGGGSAAIANNMTQANGVTFTITSIGSGTVKTNVNSSTWGTYISGSGGFVTYNPTFWKSTNGGANFTLQSTTTFNPGQNTSDGSTFCCPPGVNGEIWFCPGQLGSWIFKVIGYFSTDSGQTWTPMNQAGDLQNLFHLAFGKAKPGGSGYPAAFASGFVTDPTTSGLFRCDDPKSASRVWTPINGFRNVSPEGDRYLTADTETYGTVYQATFSTGYIYGKLG